MKNFKSHFKFNKQERSGIFFLLLIIISLQIGYFVFRSFSSDETEVAFSVDAEAQAKIDVLKELALVKDSVKIYLFNPNFITDYKGYTLGMSVTEIDRLHTFRGENKYVNSREDFQKVTQVSDSLLAVISPFFKFPEWTRKNRITNLNSKKPKAIRNTQIGAGASLESIVLKDINSATADDLKKINGIGEVLSKRIVKFRKRLGGFLIEEQLYDVYGLEPDVAKKVFLNFKVFNKPAIERINVNSASADKIASLVYIKYDVAREIVSYREINGPFSSLNELENIEGFPVTKIDRIALYLSL